MEWISFISSSQ